MERDDDDGTGTIGFFFFARCRISNASFLLLIAHWLYANACHKGEACVPFTFDVMREKFGWMLCFWNLAGVPFVYSANAFFVARNDVRLTTPRFAFVLALLLSAYYVWDTAQAQRVRFRAKHLGVGLGKRPYAFPELPWSGCARRRDIYGRVPASRQRVGRDGEDSLHCGPRDGVHVGPGVRPMAVAGRRGGSTQHSFSP